MSERRLNLARGAITLVAVITHQVHDGLTASEIRLIQALADKAGTAADHATVAGEEWLAAVAPDRPDKTAYRGVTTHRDGTLVGYAQAQANPTEPGWTAAVVVDPAKPDPALPRPLLEHLVDAVAAADPRDPRIELWTTDAPSWLADGIEAAGLHLARSLHRMERSLPIERTTNLVTRSFVPGRDDAAFLRTNARSFADHPSQGSMDQALLDLRLHEAWFEPDGFLLHEIDGELAGFCWTKRFVDESPPLGEIFIIGVDPDFQGRQLGRGLVEAGLAHLHAQGMERGFLFVEANNDPALALYTRMGFAITRTDRSFARSPATAETGSATP